MRAKYKGYFTPKNPEKYVGNAKEIVYRSGYELKFMLYLDKHPDVLKWASEEIIVPYLSPLDGRIHRYYPDFVVQQRNANGQIETVMYEVKPAKQTKPPKVGKRKNVKVIMEAATYQINIAKWKAAISFCEDRGWRFKVLTEKELGIWQSKSRA